MHVAAALGRPVVALFGPANPRCTGPWGAGHTIVSSPPRVAARGSRMEDITVDLVLAAVRARLGSACF
jgi:ADP-heptose:LPS heptosyltransferase